MISELNSCVGKYVILTKVIVPTSYQTDYKKIRMIRKVEEVCEDELGRKYVMLGEGIMMDMSSEELYSTTTKSDPIVPCPADLILRVANEKITKIIENHFKNQEYFINGTLL